MKRVIFDLDDYGEPPILDCLTLLWELKAKNPSFKVTLFGIPYFLSAYRVEQINGLGWIELAMHGWAHKPWVPRLAEVIGRRTTVGEPECALWTPEEAKEYLRLGERMGFIKGFKAPYWTISQSVMDVLAERGWWLADHKDNQGKFSYNLPVYFCPNPESVHAHTWACMQSNRSWGGGLQQMMEGDLPFSPDSEFLFVSEVLK